MQLGARALGERVIEALPQPGGVRWADVQIEDGVRISWITSCSSSTLSVSRVATWSSRARGIVPCKASPTANNRWMTWSCRSRAMRSRSVSTSSSRIWRWAVASCQARAAWSAKAAIMSNCSG